MKITLEIATEMFNSGVETLKELAVKAFPELVVDSLDEIFDSLNINKDEFYKRLEGFEQSTIGFEECKLVVKFLNKGWFPDFSNHNERKYYIWWEFDTEGNLQFFSSIFYSNYSVIPAHLCFKNEALAKEAATKYFNSFKKYIL